MKTQISIFLATLAGWLNRKQHDVIMYLNAENEILKEQLEKKDVKLALSNTQRRKLAKCGKKLGRKGLLQYASIVTPDRILCWHRKLVALKYTDKRFVKSLKEECLDRMIWTRCFCRRVAPRNFGERSLRKAVNEYVEHYHHERNHQGLDDLIPFPYAGKTKGRSGSVVKFERRMVPRASGSEGC